MLACTHQSPGGVVGHWGLRTHKKSNTKNIEKGGQRNVEHVELCESPV